MLLSPSVLRAVRSCLSCAPLIKHSLVTASLAALLVACGGGGGGGGGSDAILNPRACLDDFDDADTSYEPLRGGYLFTRGGHQELVYRNLETQQETTITTNLGYIDVPSVSGRYVGFNQRNSTPQTQYEHQLFDLSLMQPLGYTAPFVPYWSYDDKYLFTTNPNTPNDLIIETTTGAVAANFPDPRGSMSYIYWSPDSSLLKITSDKELVIYTTKGHLIYQMAIDNSTLDSFAIADTRFSPDNKFLAFSRSEAGSYSFYVVDIATGTDRKIHTSPEYPLSGDIPPFSWSSSGRYLFLQDIDQIPVTGGGTTTEVTYYLYDAHLDIKTELSDALGDNVLQLDWAATRDTLVVLSNDGTGATDDLARVHAVDAAAPDVRRSLSPAASNSFSITAFFTSPTYSYIAYAANSDDKSAVYVADAARGCFTEVSQGLLAGETIDSRIDWSASGRWAMYYPGDEEYRMVAVKADGSSQTELTDLVTEADLSSPQYVRWLAESDTVYFAYPSSPSITFNDRTQLIQLSTLETFTISTDGVPGGFQDMAGYFLPLRLSDYGN